LLPSLLEALSPLPFPFEDPPQSLTAGRAAKPLARAATDAYEPLFAPRALAAKKIEVTRWGMTLAGLHKRRAVRLRCRGNGYLGFGHQCFGRQGFGLGGQGFGGQPVLGAPASIPLALSLPFLPAFRVLAIFPAGKFLPPSPSCRAALGTAISGLRVGGTKWFLAPFE
jgi:hypothetical protein